MNMLVPNLVMGGLAVLLLAIGFARGQGEHIAGMKSGFYLLIEILPMLLFAFIVAGMLQQLLPHEIIGRWIGGESGWRGILIGTLAGGFAPGGPYVTMPLAAGFLRAGAGIGTLVAFFTAWSLWGVARLPMEVGIMGWRFALIRLACTFFFPPVAGFIAQSFFAWYK